MKKSADFNIDDLYKDSFEHANMAFEKSGMWNEVQKQLPGKERKFLFWLSWVLGIFLLSYFILLLNWKVDTKTQLAHLTSLPSTISDLKISSPPLAPSLAKIPITKAVHPISDKKAETSNTSITTNKQNSSKGVTTTTVEEPMVEPKYGLSSLSTLHDHNQIKELPLLFPENLYGIALVDGENEEDIKLPKRPDPNSWSRCSVKDRPLFFSDIYAFGGYPLITNSVNPDPSNDYNAFLSRWNEGEEAVINYGFGMMVGIGAYWGGSFSTGLEFQQIQNKLNRSQTVIERITVYDEMAYYYLDSNNNRVWVADSVSSTRVYTREVQAAKTHTLINVPFLLGYHIEKNRWRVGITGGVNLHVMNQFEGKVLDPSGQLIDATTGTPTAVYDTNLGVSFIGGFDLGYFITMQTEFYISPRFRYHPGSWLNNSHPLESRMQMVNLQAGARWHF